jgi:hypothetical protein
VVESRSLVPNIAMTLTQRAAFRTDMQLTLVLFRYGQSCQAAIAPDAVWGACDPALSVTLAALKPDVPATGSKYLTCMYQTQTQARAVSDLGGQSWPPKQCTIVALAIPFSSTNQNSIFGSSISKTKCD